MLPLNTNIRVAYANGKDDEQNFIQNLSLFLCTFLKEHGQLVEKKPNLRETLMEVEEIKHVKAGKGFYPSPNKAVSVSSSCRMVEAQ